MLFRSMQTHRTVHNCQDNQDNCQDSENRQRGASCVVLCAVAWLVYAHELEEKVGERGDVETDGCYHARFDFFARPKGSEGEDDDCDWDGGDGEVKFAVCHVCDNDEKLDGEAQEEVEIKLEKCDINLKSFSEIQASCRKGFLPEMRGICASF